MRVVALERRVVTWELDGRGAARGLRYRTAIVVELRTEDGALGVGEAAPLPGMSLDTLDDADAAIAAFAERLPLAVEAAEPAVARVASPSARFAIETALLDACARRRGVRIAELLAERIAARDRAAAEPLRERPVAVVVDSAEQAKAAFDGGARCLKIKVGAGGDLERVRAIAAAAPGASLRLDANRAWPREQVGAWLGRLAELPIEYVEEPCRDAHELLAAPLPCRIALDESLASLPHHALDRALRSSGLAALVLKPTLLGGLGACLDLAARARAAGVDAIATHTLEGPIGTSACLELALALASDAPAGLAPHPALAAWTSPGASPTAGREHRPPPVAGRSSRGPASLLALLSRLDDRLSITSAAARRPDAPAIITPTSTLRFADAATAAARSARPRVIVAVPTLETIAAIHAALDGARPIALLHPALADAELARQRELVDTTTLPADAAVVLFTSGSTGRARGVVLSRAALLAAADASAATLGWTPDDAWLVALPLAHAGGLSIVVRCLAARTPIVLADEPLPDALARATLASLVPTQLAAVLDDPSWRPPPRLRAVLLGGAAASPALLERAAARGVPFLTTYGTTESFGQLATAPLARAGDPHAPLVPLPGVELRGGTREAPAAIRARAALLATRYLDGAPIAPELVTADLGYVDDLGLQVVGRADDVIVTGGENVHPATVEAVLAATPGVRAACAFAVADERWGQIVGAAVAADAHTAWPAALAAWHAALPPHARPRELAVVRELPVLANGKLDRRAAARLPRAPLRYR